MDDQLITFVRESAARGTTADITRQQLTSVGWDAKQVDHAISAVYPSAPLSTLSNSVSSSLQVHRGKWIAALSIILFFGISSVVIGYVLFLTSSSHSLSRVNDSLADSASSVVSLPNSEYQTYINDEFHFRLTILTDWSYKEYDRNKYGEYRIAFGRLNELPKDYFGEGNYVWIRVFPISSKQKYETFIKESKKEGVNQLTLSGTKAFDTGTMIGVEFENNVLELHPPTEQASDGTTTYSEISKRIISSLRFIK